MNTNKFINTRTKLKKSKSNNKNKLVVAFRKGFINEKEIYAIFKDKNLGEFYTFLNSLSEKEYIKHSWTLMIECRKLLFGKNKAQETFDYFKSIGKLDRAKMMFDYVAKQNKYFFPK